MLRDRIATVRTTLLYPSGMEAALSTVTIPVPTGKNATLVVGAPGAEPGHWAGAPSAVRYDGIFYLAYRLRRPVGEGRGYANVVARSADGVVFEDCCTICSEELGAESLERPAIIRGPDGSWRLYVSVATPGTKHWRVDVLEADDPAAFYAAAAMTVLSGNSDVGVKDPVILYADGGWHLWATCHPLERWDDADRMSTCYATSRDGLIWNWQGTALAPRAGSWDARGARITAVAYEGGSAAALYDGRATAAENYEERTGLAVGSLAELTARGNGPLAQSPYPPHGLRYASVVPLPGGDARMYYEMTGPVGAHALWTELAG
jgi:hypothetical protein